MIDLHEEEDNNIDAIISKDLKEKMLKIIDDESTIKPKSGRADNIDIIVSKRLKTKRVISGLTQQDIGKAVGVSIQQVQKYEKGTNRISSGKLFTLANYLKVPLAYFYEQEEDNKVIDNVFVEDVNIASEKEVINLIRAFRGIKSLQSRKKIIELVQAIS